MVIDRSAVRYFVHQNLKAKAAAVGAASGGLEGYAAVWNEIDFAGEILRRGAFIETLKSRVAARQIKLMDKHLAHGGGTRECVGTVVEAREDAYGLWIRGEFAADARSQEVRTKVVGRHVGFMSVGYMIKEYVVRDPRGAAEEAALAEAFAANDKDSVIELLKCDLEEVTITPFPIQKLAVIVSAKGRESSVVCTKRKRRLAMLRLGF